MDSQARPNFTDNYLSLSIISDAACISGHGLFPRHGGQGSQARQDGLLHQGEQNWVGRVLDSVLFQHWVESLTDRIFLNIYSTLNLAF